MLPKKNQQELEALLSKKHVVESEANDGELTYLWAVSYSDLLMVLLSFFIIFFQMGETESRKSVLSDIVLAFNKGNGLDKQSGGQSDKAGTNRHDTNLQSNRLDSAARIPSSDKSSTGSGTAGPVNGGMKSGFRGSGAEGFGIGNQHTFDGSKLVQILNEKLTASKLQVLSDQVSEAVVIDFAEDLYGPGEFALSAKNSADLKEVLEIIKPYREIISLSFIGHSDDVPVSKIQGKIVDSNLVLSTLRGTRAAEVAITEGFDPNFIIGQGAAERSRNTRSITLRIEERKNYDE